MSNAEDESRPASKSEKEFVDMDELVSFQLIGQGRFDAVKKCTYFPTVGIKAEGATESERFSVGDCVRVLGGDEDTWPCRIERLWETPDREVRFEARWLYCADEMAGHPHKFAGPITQLALVDQMEPHEVVLSAETDENDCCSILAKIDVRFTEDVPPTLTPNADPKRVLYCRYFLKLEHPPNPDSNIPAITSVNRFHDDSNPDRKPAAKTAAEKTDETVRAIEADAAASMSSESSDDDDDDDNDSKRQAAHVEGEGSVLRGEIQVGKRHQVEVPKFRPGQAVRSRNPTLVWKKGAMMDNNGDDDNHSPRLFDFLEQVAVLHNTFLDKHELSQQEPHSPLPTGPTEHWMRASQDGMPLTGSFMSTASMLAATTNGKKLPQNKSALRKECDPDVIMEILSKHDYDTEKALEDIRGRLGDLSKRAWTWEEKELYDDGFRRHQTDLRRIGQMIPSRSVKDTIDFHFRYKIPDQFRIFQNRKREQAVRMVECMEKRRYHDSIQGNPPPDHQKRRKKSNTDGEHWTETLASDVPQALEARRRKAREFLLSVNDIVGPRAMVEMAKLLKELHSSRSTNKKDALISLLNGNQQLKSRLMEFFPREQIAA